MYNGLWLCVVQVVFVWILIRSDEEDVRKDGKIFNSFKNCTKCAPQTEDN